MSDFSAKIDFIEVYQRIMELLINQNKSFSDLKSKGVNPQVLTRLSNGSATSADKLYYIAKYLDTTCEYLLTGKDEMNGIFSNREEFFMQFYRHLPSDYKMSVMILTQSLYKIAKSSNRLVKDDIEEIVKYLNTLNQDSGLDYVHMSQEEIIEAINNERKKNDDFEEYLRLNFTQITDKKKKDLARLEIDKILEKYKDSQI